MGTESAGFAATLDQFVGAQIVGPLAKVLFFDLWFWDDTETGIKLPLVVAWLMFGAVFFTLRFRFINFRGFRHAIDCVRGRYSRPEDPGELSHFQALSAALSATVGLGNIAGVAVAVGLGGPGAVFWMTVAGFLGMTSKFAECTLGQKYRVVRLDGRVSGGPMHYLKDGLAELGLPSLGKALAVIFAILCIGGSFGAGNMFQANQSYSQLISVIGVEHSTAAGTIFGVGLAILVGLVIIGGIKRIGQVAGLLVPFMCVTYVLCGFLILFLNAEHLFDGMKTIVRLAFTPDAAFGGVAGAIVQGFKRAAFSNEAGIGSASIAHSAASTPEPVREGLVALLEPFIDTIIVCNMTGLVLVVTGAYATPAAGTGIAMTSWAFATVLPWFPALLSLTAFCFAFSTMISWSYYGEQCWAYLLGLRSILAYKILFLISVWLGCVIEFKNVIDFSDLMVLGMALPNIAGIILLSGKIKSELDAYWGKLKRGEFVRTR